MLLSFRGSVRPLGGTGQHNGFLIFQQEAEGGSPAYFHQISRIINPKYSNGFKGVLKNLSQRLAVGPYLEFFSAPSNIEDDL
jgi:hypothetical protein